MTRTEDATFCLLA